MRPSVLGCTPCVPPKSGACTLEEQTPTAINRLYFPNHSSPPFCIQNIAHPIRAQIAISATAPNAINVIVTSTSHISTSKYFLEGIVQGACLHNTHGVEHCVYVPRWLDLGRSIDLQRGDACALWLALDLHDLVLTLAL